MVFTEFGLTDKEKAPHREALNKHDMGSKKYKAMIDRGEREADKKNLPFTFSKPKRAQSRNTLVWCTECGTHTRVTKTTHMVVCTKCKAAFFVTEENSKR